MTRGGGMWEGEHVKIGLLICGNPGLPDSIPVGEMSGIRWHEVMFRPFICMGMVERGDRQPTFGYAMISSFTRTHLEERRSTSQMHARDHGVARIDIFARGESPRNLRCIQLHELVFKCCEFMDTVRFE